MSESKSGDPGGATDDDTTSVGRRSLRSARSNKSDKDAGLRIIKVRNLKDPDTVVRVAITPGMTFQKFQDAVMDKLGFLRLRYIVFMANKKKIKKIESMKDRDDVLVYGITPQQHEDIKYRLEERNRKIEEKKKKEEMKKKKKLERNAKVREAHSTEYIFPKRTLGLELEPGDRLLDCVVSDWHDENIPYDYPGIQRGDVVLKIGDEEVLHRPFREILDRIRRGPRPITLTFMSQRFAYTRTFTQEYEARVDDRLSRLNPLDNVHYAGYNRLRVLRNFADAVRDGDRAEVSKLLEGPPKEESLLEKEEREERERQEKEEKESGKKKKGTPAKKPTPEAKGEEEGEAAKEDELVDSDDDRAVPLDTASRTGDTPLHMCIGRGRVGLAEEFMEKGLKVTDKNSLGQFPIHYAAINGETAMLSKLLEAGSEVDARDESGRTPLMYALMYNHQETAERLVGAGASVLTTDYDWGWGSLHFACLCGNTELVDFLTDEGGNIFQLSLNGTSPSTVSLRARHATMAREMQVQLAVAPAQQVLPLPPPDIDEIVRSMFPWSTLGEHLKAKLKGHHEADFEKVITDPISKDTREYIGEMQGALWIGDYSACNQKFFQARGFTAAVLICDKGDKEKMLRQMSWLRGGVVKLQRDEGETRDGTDGQKVASFGTGEKMHEDHEPVMPKCCIVEAGGSGRHMWYDMVPQLPRVTRFVYANMMRKAPKGSCADLPRTHKYAMDLRRGKAMSLAGRGRVLIVDETGNKGAPCLAAGFLVTKLEIVAQECLNILELARPKAFPLDWAYPGVFDFRDGLLKMRLERDAEKFNELRLTSTAGLGEVTPGGVDPLRTIGEDSDED